MNAMAHDSWFDLSPYESEEDTPGLSLRDEAALVAVISVAIPVLVATIVLQVAHHALILLWAIFGLPSIRLTRRLHQRWPAEPAVASTNAVGSDA